MIPPSRTTSERVLLTVTGQFLELVVGEGEHRQEAETPFDAAAFDPRLPTADNRLNVLEARGELLWTAAFSGSLGLFVDQAAARARDRGAAVTLQVVTDSELPTVLRWLPWEVLFDPQRRDYLSLKSGWSVVRGVDPFQTVRTLSLDDLKVRILVLNATPEAAAEAEAVRRVAADHGGVEIVRVHTAGQLKHGLDGDVDIVHVIGHGLGEGLVLPDDEQRYAGRTEIAAAVAANRRIGLAVFSGGATAQVAEEVARQADVSVLAHRNAARAEHAHHLSEMFYRNLLDAIPADVALTEARRALDRKFPGERAWTGAVLITGWPPLTPARTKVATTSGRPGSPDPTLELDAIALMEMLHTRNRDRAKELLAGGDWGLVTKQLQEAEAHLRRLRPPAAP